MSFFATNCLIALIALSLERWLGYPNWLYKQVRHPVVWIGALIALCDRLLNRDVWSQGRRRLSGVSTLFIILLVTGLIAIVITVLLRQTPGSFVLEAILATTMLAQKSLKEFVQAVEKALFENIEAGRQAVRHIVGRDPAALDESGVAKAAIESLAENTSDGIIAPLFWLVIFGLPGVVLYKAINTADSMIGHKSEKYRAFGWASARFDDLMNFIPARLCGLLFVLAAFSEKKWKGRAAFDAMMRDAMHHVSPNAGWAEAAMAGALGLVLGGARFYQGQEVPLATMGDGRADLTKADIKEALQLYARALTFTMFAMLLLSAAPFLR